MTPAQLVPLAELRSTRTALARIRAAVPHRGRSDPDPRTHERVSTVVAAIAPRLAPDRLALLVRYALWSIVLDDRIDPPPARSGSPAEPPMGSPRRWRPRPPGSRPTPPTRS